MIRLKKPQATTTVSLLDRLTERSTSEVSEATSSRGDLPITDPEKAILRDLSWLLNTTHLAASRDLSRWPNVAKSVLNFGIPEFTGRLLSSSDVPSIEAALKKAIEAFEPRLHSGSVEVEAVVEKDRTDRRAVTLRIVGQYVDNAELVPLELRATIDLESGRLEPSP